MALPLNTVALAKLRLPASPAYIALAEARNFSVYDYIREEACKDHNQNNDNNSVKTIKALELTQILGQPCEIQVLTRVNSRQD